MVGAKKMVLHPIPLFEVLRIVMWFMFPEK